MQKPIALFDFDGTLTSRDSFRAILKCQLAKAPWRALLVSAGLPLFCATALLQWDRRWAKSWILWSLTVGLGRDGGREALLECAKSCAAQPGFWLPDILERINAHRQNGVSVVICTASCAFWVEPMLVCAGLTVDKTVGSELAHKWGGWIYHSPNCYGEQKPFKLRQQFETGTFVAAYSDHPSDASMMNLAAMAYIVAPKPSHLHRFQSLLHVPYQVIDGLSLNTNAKSVSK